MALICKKITKKNMNSKFKMNKVYLLLSHLWCYKMIDDDTCRLWCIGVLMRGGERCYRPTHIPITGCWLLTAIAFRRCKTGAAASFLINLRIIHQLSRFCNKHYRKCTVIPSFLCQSCPKLCELRSESVIRLLKAMLDHYTNNKLSRFTNPADLRPKCWRWINLCLLMHVTDLPFFLFSWAISE